MFGCCTKRVINTIFSEYLISFLISKPSHTQFYGQWHWKGACPTYSFVTMNNFFSLSYHLTKFGHGVFPYPVYVRTHYVCVCVCMYVSVYACVCMCICILCLCVMMCICMYVSVYMCVCMHVCMPVYACMYICMYVFIQDVTGGMCETSGECSLGQTIPI
jgi:hypothetical protein